jgi:hypothetical protein
MVFNVVEVLPLRAEGTKALPSKSLLRAALNLESEFRIKAAFFMEPKRQKETTNQAKKRDKEPKLPCFSTESVTKPNHRFQVLCGSLWFAASLSHVWLFRISSP